jgi:copper transport protein
MKVFVALLLAALAWLVPGGPVRAHAGLVGSVPADGARLAAAPASVELRFNEPVTPLRLRLVDASGRTIAGGDRAPAAASERLVLAVPRDLPDGAYVVAYRVISADTHPVPGAIAFVVGDAPAAHDHDHGHEHDHDHDHAHGGGDWQAVSVLVRLVRDAALAVGIGGIFFLVWIGDPGRIAPALVACLPVAALAAVLGAGIAGARALDAAFPGDLLAAEVWRVALSTSAADSAAMLLTALGAAALAAATRGRLAAAAALVFAGIGAALTGHAAGAANPAFVPAAHAVHVVAALVWLGAFVPLLAAARASDASAAGRLARRFSPVGIAALAALVAAATAIVAYRLARGGLGEYGLWLSAKGGLLLALVAIASDNRDRVVPALLAGKDVARAWLARNLRIDLALGLGVLAVTAVLVHTDPGGGHVHAPTPPATTAQASAEGYVLTATRRAARIEWALAGPQGAAAAPLAVEAVLSVPGAAIDGLRRVPFRDGALYVIDEPVLAAASRIELRVEILIDAFRKAEIEVVFGR